MPETSKHIRLVCRANGSSKEYWLHLEKAYNKGVDSDWTCRCEYGKIGGTLTTVFKPDATPRSYEEAAKAFERELKVRYGKGYVEESKGAPEPTGPKTRVVSASEVAAHPRQSLLASDYVGKLDVKAFESFLPQSPDHAIGPEELPGVGWNGWMVEEKYDGSLYMARFYDKATPTEGGRSSFVKFTSRRISVKDNNPVCKTGNLPQFHSAPASLGGTLLIGEIQTPERRFKSVAGIMGAGWEKAWDRQRTNGLCDYTVFDCVWYKGRDLRDLPMLKRRKIAIEAIMEWVQHMIANGVVLPWATLRSDREIEKLVRISPLLAEGKTPAEWYRAVVSRGGEGLMLKEPTMPYGKGVTKCKKVIDVSVFVTGFKEGAGKYVGEVGALKFSVLGRDKKIVEIGQCSGMTDALRLEISNSRIRFMNRVIDVACQPPDDPEAWKPSQRLRHPRFLRFRDDLSFKQCTEDKMRSDFLRAKKG